MPGGNAALGTAGAAVAALVVTSLFVGGYDITLANLLNDADAREMFVISRVPRTLALVFSAAAMSLSGVIMQLLTQNRFVEPTTTGTSQWAGLGVLAGIIVWPAAPFWVKLLLATAGAFIGSMIFWAALRRIALRNSLVVPLVGIMLGAVVSSVTVLAADSFGVLQSMAVWRSGGFSGVVRGFYEPLWLVALVAAATWVAADRFTAAGLGADLATGLGVDHRRTVLLGTVLVSLATGVTTVVVGFLPFLGLIVPNAVSLLLGDNLRRTIPWVVLLGVTVLIGCDLIGRVVVAPLEIPASVVLGVLGAAGFIGLILARRRQLVA